MNWMDLVSAVLGLTCVFLAGRRLVANFWVGYLYNIFLFALFWHNALWASMAIQVVSFAINATGHWRWTHPSTDEKEADGSLVVSGIRRGQYPFYILALAALFVSLYLILGHTDDSQPLMDAVCTSLILLAQWLSAQKKVECWYVWLVVNVTTFILYVKASLVFMPIVSCLYLANGIWSLVSWKKNEKNS